MDNILVLVSTISGLIILAGLIGTTFVSITRANYAKATVEALRGDIADRDKRIDFLEEENTRKTQDIQDLKTRNTVLEDLVTNRAELAEYIEVAKSHELQAEQRHYEQIAMDEQILESIQQLKNMWTR